MSVCQAVAATALLDVGSSTGDRVAMKAYLTLGNAVSRETFRNEYDQKDDQQEHEHRANDPETSQEVFSALDRSPTTVFIHDYDGWLRNFPFPRLLARRWDRAWR